MGKEVIKIITEYPNMLLSCGFDINDNDLNAFPVYKNLEDIISPVDIIIDFSVPSCTLNILEFATKNKIPIVIATTGFSQEEMNKIKKVSNIIPIFQSVNMSLDINIMSKLASKLAIILKNTDIEIIETHHHNKKDSPSGTALLLADSINKSLNNEMKYTFDRHSIHNQRKKNEIGFSSIRGGNIVGEHTVKFFGLDETLEITHTCYSRSIYADRSSKSSSIFNNPKNWFIYYG